MYFFLLLKLQKEGFESSEVAYDAFYRVVRCLIISLHTCGAEFIFNCHHLKMFRNTTRFECSLITFENSTILAYCSVGQMAIKGPVFFVKGQLWKSANFRPSNFPFPAS